MRHRNQIMPSFDQGEVSFLNDALEALEPRRLLSTGFTFVKFALTGSPLFQPGGTTTVVALIRSNTTPSVGTASVDFKFVDVGFTSGNQARFDDPGATEMSTTSITGIPAGAGGKSFSFPLTFSATMPPGRYALIGKISGATASPDDQTLLFGIARVMPNNGVLVIDGTGGADHISIDAIQGAPGKAQYDVNVNGYTESFSSTKIHAFTVNGEDGNDVIVATGLVPRLVISGGNGNDKLVGGDGDDTLSGNAGNDSLYGNAGEDRLNGNGGNDRLYGGDGVDRLYGYAGNDYLDAGAASDRLDGGSGSDTLYGQGGNDRFFTRDGEIDYLFGGSGKDTAIADTFDVLQSI